MEKRNHTDRSRLSKGVKYSLLCTIPLSLTACDSLFAEEPITAYEECILEQYEGDQVLNCEDEDSDWYKKKGYKSKKAKSAYYKSSSGSYKSGYGSSGYSSGG